jgi:hypothetical protein
VLLLFLRAKHELLQNCIDINQFSSLCLRVLLQAPGSFSNNELECDIFACIFQTFDTELRKYSLSLVSLILYKLHFQFPFTKILGHDSMKNSSIKLIEHLNKNVSFPPFDNFNVYV